MSFKKAGNSLYSDYSKKSMRKKLNNLNGV